jgi:hypothetical protein
VRLDGDEVAPDADDGDAGHATTVYISQCGLVRSGVESRYGSVDHYPQS